jgi:hypothetical protein
MKKTQLSSTCLSTLNDLDKSIIFAFLVYVTRDLEKDTLVLFNLKHIILIITSYSKSH